MDYAKTAFRLHDAGQEEDALKVFIGGFKHYLHEVQSLFNGASDFDKAVLIVAAERVCKSLRSVSDSINGQANAFDELFGEWVSESIITMVIAGGEEERCWE